MPLYPIIVTDALGATAVLNLSIIIQSAAKLKPLFNPIDNIVFDIQDTTTFYSGVAEFQYFELIDDTTTVSELIEIKDSITANIVDTTTHTSTLQSSEGFSMPYIQLTETTNFQMVANRGYVLKFPLITDTINLFLPLTSTLIAGDRIEFYPLVGKALIKPHPSQSPQSYRYDSATVSDVQLDNNDVLIGFVYVNAVTGWLPQFIYDLISTPVAASTLNDGIVAAYDFEQNTNDLINTSHLTTTGIAAYTPGIVGDGYLFDTDNKPLTTPANSNINVVNSLFEYETDFTIAFFTDVFDSATLVDKFGNDSFSPEYQITAGSNEGSRFFQLRCRSSTISTPGSLTTSVNGYFVMVSFTLSTRLLRIYAKNLETAEIFQRNDNNVPEFPVDGIGELQVSNRNNKYTDGLSIWKRLLTNDEIIELSAGKQYPY